MHWDRDIYTHTRGNSTWLDGTDRALSSLKRTGTERNEGGTGQELQIIGWKSHMGGSFDINLLVSILFHYSSHR